MHRSPTVALPAALCVFLALCTPSPAGTGGTQALADARARLARNDAKGAIDVLEGALPGAGEADRSAVLDILRTAYGAAARQAEADGRRAEAEAYRDNLDILQRPSRPATPKPPETPPPPPAPKHEPPATAVLRSLPALAVPPQATPEPEARHARPVSSAPAKLEPVQPALESAGEVSVETADTAFRAARYEEARKLYTALDRAKRLPADRRDHWAYCRAVEVVRRINAHPQSQAEWAQINGEIKAIRALSPANWMAEYLQSLTAERSQGLGARPDRSNRVVVRGSSPEEASRPTLPAAAPQTTRLPDSAQVWNGQPVESANFRVYYLGTDAALAQRVASAAESARGVQTKRWGAVTPGGAWSPRCEILLYSTAKDFTRDTAQPPASPGFSRIGMSDGRIIHRRIHLRTDHPALVKAILPHELTHVVLADLFPRQQIPRWADEGMAVLSEPLAEQSTRAAGLDEPLQAGQLFRLNDLMAMDYPDPKYMDLYYAQSVSLTRYLVETGSPTQFIRFVQEAQRAGFEPALRSTYAISGYADLQARWLAFARERSSGATMITATAEDPEKSPAAPKR